MITREQKKMYSFILKTKTKKDRGNERSFIFQEGVRVAYFNMATRGVAGGKTDH